MIKNNYDYIIYGASLPGSLLAERLAEKRYSILLLNEYGFPGGSLTESLNCCQNVLGVSSKIKNVIAIINENKPGTFRKTDDAVIFNPESVKFAVQKIIDESEVDLLYHVKIVELNTEPNSTQVKLSGKEGLLQINCERLIDATDGHLLSNIVGANSLPENIEYNLIAANIKKAVCRSLPRINRIQSLDDGRVFLNFKFPPQEILFIENLIQTEIAKIDEMIKMKGGRIQLLPAQTNIINKIDIPDSNDLYVDVDTIIGKSFPVNEILIKASMIENLDLSKI